MQINITTRRGKTNENLQIYAEESVQTLTKFYDRIHACEVILEYEKATQVAEIRISVSGEVLVATGKNTNIYKSIDEAVVNMERKLKRYKAKFEAKPKKVLATKEAATQHEE